jgi:flagellar biogenesis protein FliO
MYDCAERDSFTRHKASQPFRFNWWVLGIAGILALAGAICLKPPSAPTSAPVVSASPQTTAETQKEPATGPAAEPVGPKELSLFAPMAKAGLCLLVVYAAGLALVRLRRGGSLLGAAFSRPAEGLLRLRSVESLPLGRQGMLHLVEVDEATLLVGVVMDQMQVLWTNTPPGTSAFAPVAPEQPSTPAPTPSAPPPLATVKPAPPAIQLDRPVRAEADWAQERGRLISALMKADPALSGGEQS